MPTVTLYQLGRDALLKQAENAPRPQAKANLNRREIACRMLERAFTRAEVKYAEAGDGGQVSRQVHDKENLSFHYMIANWPESVLAELTLEMAVRFGFKVVKSIEQQERAI